MQAIIITTIFLSYAALLFQYRTTAKHGANEIAEALCQKSSLELLNRRTIVTAPLMILSLALCSVTHQNSFLQINWNEKPALITLPLLCLCFLISVYSGLQSKQKLGAGVSTLGSMKYLSLRIPSLVIYEIFFRGVLLGIFLDWFPISVAVSFNIVLYALAHAFGSRREFIGSFPFGFVLCYVTIIDRSILPAVLLHLSLALPYESILLTRYQLLTKKIKS